MDEATTIELIPTCPNKEGFYNYTVWVCDKDILHNLKTARNLLLENDSEEGIIVIKKIKYNL